MANHVITPDAFRIYHILARVVAGLADNILKATATNINAYHLVNMNMISRRLLKLQKIAP